MTETSQSQPALGPAASVGPFAWLGVAGLVWVLLVGVAVIGAGFTLASGGREGAAAIFEFASNPLVGVILGVLATTLVQSSSGVTSVIVGLVAGGVPIATAIPMIMGSNMGTTITNTIVSLGSLRDGKEFRRAFAAATVHDFFNLISIVVLLPIEMIFSPLERLSGALAALFAGGGDASVRHLDFVRTLTRPASNAIRDGVGGFGDTTGGVLMIVVGVALVLVAVSWLGKLLKMVMKGRAAAVVNRAVGRGTLSGVVSGALVTVVVQSSSTTTSLVVPLAANGTLTLRQVFPFTMGANIGTTVTALLAATAVTGPYADVAMQIALVHLIYNVIGVLAFSLIPPLGALPLMAAERLSALCERSRLWALGYILGVFFALPGLVFAGQALLERPVPAIETALEDAALQDEVAAEIVADDVTLE